MSTLYKLVLPEIRELIREKDFKTLRQVVSEWLVPDLATLVASLEPDEQAALFRTLDSPRAAETFSYLTFHVQGQLVDSLPIGEFSKILGGMPPDDRTRSLA